MTESSSPPQSKASYVLDRIREDIAEGFIMPGQSLRQNELAVRYGVSSTPVREALRLLEAEGAITYAPHKGATIAEMNPEQIEDIYLMRLCVEGLATRLAVERGPAESFNKAFEIHEQLCARESEDPRELALLNRRLHFELYEIGSPWISNYVQGLWRFMPPELTTWTDDSATETFIRQHKGIIEAIRHGDALKAEHLMQDHIRTSMQFRLDQLAGHMDNS